MTIRIGVTTEETTYDSKLVPAYLRKEVAEAIREVKMYSEGKLFPKVTLIMEAMKKWTEKQIWQEAANYKSFRAWMNSASYQQARQVEGLTQKIMEDMGWKYQRKQTQKIKSWKESTNSMDISIG